MVLVVFRSCGCVCPQSTYIAHPPTDAASPSPSHRNPNTKPRTAEGQATSTSTTTTTPEPDEASLRRLLEQDFMRPERLEVGTCACVQMFRCKGKERERERESFVCVIPTLHPTHQPPPTTTTQTNNKKQAALLAAQQRLAAATPALLERMALYLDHNSATRAILFKPVRLRVSQSVPCPMWWLRLLYLYIYIYIPDTLPNQSNSNPTNQYNNTNTIPNNEPKQVLNTLAQLKELLSLALAVAATHPQPPTTTAPFLLPPSIDGPLTAMRAALTRALDGGGGELLDASASRSGSLSSASSAGTGGGAGGDAVGPSRAAQTAGGRGGSAAL